MKIYDTEIEYLSICLENCETIIIPGKAILDFKLAEDVTIFSEGLYYPEVALKISSVINSKRRPNFMMGSFLLPKQRPFSRLMLGKDITQILIVTDEFSVNIFVPYIMNRKKMKIEEKSIYEIDEDGNMNIYLKKRL